MNSILNVAKVVSVITGTVIGAGFASGKEIYIFFAQYGKSGLLGTLDYQNNSYARAGGVADPIPEDAPEFLKDYNTYYKTKRGNEQ